eukprot:3319986-Lingulodinium_polyedra.AAC.1
MERASVRFASRCGGGRPIQPRLCLAFENATQRCGCIHRSPPQRLADRTLARAMRAPVFWRAHGVRER